MKILVPAAVICITAVCVLASAYTMDADRTGTETESSGIVSPDTVPSGDITAFSWDILGGTGNGNMIFSPYSLYTALAIMANGAEPGSGTEAEILKALRSDGTGSLNAYLSSLGLENDPGLVSSNMILIDSSVAVNHPLNEEYRKTVSEMYSCAVSDADFRNSIDSVKKFIQEWVSEKTRGMIPDYESAADSDTVADIINTICLKKEWMHKFDPQNSFKMKFTCGNGTVCSAETMHITLRGANYYDDGKYRALEIPYSDGKSHMTVILPSDGKSLDVLGSWKKETDEYRNSFLKKLSENVPDQSVSLYLPKLDLSAEYDLEKLLAPLNLSRSFSGCAEYTKIADNYCLKIGGGKHQAVVRADEEGTEAAAVTEIVMKCTAVYNPNPVIEFRCDVPFVFMIEQSGIPLFIGHASDLSGSE